MNKSGNLGFFEKMLGNLAHPAAQEGRWVGDAIRIHLMLLLNTREGTLPHLTDYGVPPMSAFYTDYPDSMLRLQQVIAKLIKEYEPRLHNPRVQQLDPTEDVFRASFLITGEIEDNRGDRSLVKYRTTFASNGQASLQDHSSPY